MKTGKKIGIAVGAVLLLGVAGLITVRQLRKGVVTVQTGSVSRKSLASVVTASGEIKPLTYTNVMAEGFGKIIGVTVKEGDHVNKGDILLRLEDIQPAADVAAQRAGLDSAGAAVRSAQANGVSANADVAQRKAALEQAKLDWARGEQLYKEQLIAKQEYDSRRAAYDSAVAAEAAAEARIDQARADLQRAQIAIRQNEAVLTRTSDVLRKTTYRAPIGGLVTYIAVRVGENVVPGIQNAAGSYLMTISDMSVVTAEVMVDETDIVNVKEGQVADATIDAIPGKTFKGHVAQVGTQAVLRTSGLASTQSTNGNQEARDFKVVVTLDNPPAGLRPGLSATAKVITQEKSNVMVIPIQALAVRTRTELARAAADAGTRNGNGVTLAAGPPQSDKSSDSGASNSEEVQGVFVVRGNKAEFVPVETGIAGVSDIEVLSGLHEGDQIVTGSYKALRTLLPTATVKIDNQPQPTTAGENAG